MASNLIAIMSLESLRIPWTASKMPALNGGGNSCLTEDRKQKLILPWYILSVSKLGCWRHWGVLNEEDCSSMSSTWIRRWELYKSSRGASSSQRLDLLEWHSIGVMRMKCTLDSAANQSPHESFGLSDQEHSWWFIQYKDFWGLVSFHVLKTLLPPPPAPLPAVATDSLLWLPRLVWDGRVTYSTSSYRFSRVDEWTLGLTLTMTLLEIAIDDNEHDDTWHHKWFMVTYENTKFYLELNSTTIHMPWEFLSAERSHLICPHLTWINQNISMCGLLDHRK